MSERRIRLGTRGSVLARTQASLVAQALAAVDVHADIIVITTSGDVRPTDTAWGEGAFVDALESALRTGQIDAAVHSAKDMPTSGGATADLVVAAYVARIDARDTLVAPAGSRPLSIDDLPEAATVGTDSPRRAGFLLSLRPDLHVREMSGNVDSRLARLDRGDVDALVLAVAGLQRLGQGERIGLPIDPTVIPPAAGQGALAVQARAADDELLATLGRLDDAEVRAAVEAERAVLAIMGGGCRAPVGAYATLEGDLLTMVAGRVQPDGDGRFVGSWSGVRGAGLALAAEVAQTLA